jgi:hypothetical protein
MFGSEFGWPSADIWSVQQTVTPVGAGEDTLRANTGGNAFLDYRSQVLNPDWTIQSMLYENSTLNALFPSRLDTRTKQQGGTDDGTRAGLERWLYLTQALQAHCVGGSVSAYRQRSEVMGSVNWAVNSIWQGAPAWGSISHDGSWKMLHYRLRHVFADVLLSFVYPPTPTPVPPSPPPPPPPPP